MLLDLLLLAVVLAIGAAAGFLYRARTPTLEAQAIDFSKRFGVDAASAKFDLPVKAVRRLRVIAGIEPRTCASCEHFDLEKGQLAVKSHGIIAQVTQALPPGVLSKDKNSNQSWNEFGACGVRPGTVLGARDWCGNKVHAKLEKPGDLWA